MPSRQLAIRHLEAEAEALETPPIDQKRKSPVGQCSWLNSVCGQTIEMGYSSDAKGLKNGKRPMQVVWLTPPSWNGGVIMKL